MGADTGVTTRSLASTATLDSLKKQARSFLKAVQSGDASARSRVAPYFADIANAGLQDIQLVLARESASRSIRMTMPSFPCCASPVRLENMATELFQRDWTGLSGPNCLKTNRRSGQATVKRLAALLRLLRPGCLRVLQVDAALIRREKLGPDLADLVG